MIVSPWRSIEAEQSLIAKRASSKRKKRSHKPNPRSSPKDIAGSHGHASHGPSILWPALYEHLLGKGHSKSSAAKISNGLWNKKNHGG